MSFMTGVQLYSFLLYIIFEIKQWSNFSFGPYTTYIFEI